MKFEDQIFFSVNCKLFHSYVNYQVHRLMLIISSALECNSPAECLHIFSAVFSSVRIIYFPEPPSPGYTVSYEMTNYFYIKVELSPFIGPLWHPLIKNKMILIKTFIPSPHYVSLLAGQVLQVSISSIMVFLIQSKAAVTLQYHRIIKWKLYFSYNPICRKFDEILYNFIINRE